MSAFSLEQVLLFLSPKHTRRMRMLSNKCKFNRLQQQAAAQKLISHIAGVTSETEQNRLEMRLVRAAVERNSVAAHLNQTTQLASSTGLGITVSLMRQRMSFLTTCQVMLDRAQTKERSYVQRQQLLHDQLSIVTQEQSATNQAADRIAAQVRQVQRIERRILELFEAEEHEALHLRQGEGRCL